MDIRPDADFLEDIIAGYLYKSINIDEFNHPMTTRGGWLNTSIVPGDSSYNLGPIVYNFAHNVTPFNNYTPFRGSPAKRSSGGCTAVAMSEIMAWHEWPEIGVFPRYNSNTPTPDTVSVSYILTSQQRLNLQKQNYSDATVAAYVANLIIETGYRLNTNYAVDVSLAFPDDVPFVFEEMGFTADSISDYNYADIEYDIINRVLPVFMAGWKHSLDTAYGGHAYVIDGIRRISNNNFVDKYIALIEGNTTNGVYYDPEGNCAIWFNEKMFTTDKDSSSYVQQPGEILYPYRYGCRIIKNIKRNPYKNGSNNPNWYRNNKKPY